MYFFQIKRKLKTVMRGNEGAVRANISLDVSNNVIIKN